MALIVLVVGGAGWYFYGKRARAFLASKGIGSGTKYSRVRDDAESRFV